MAIQGIYRIYNKLNNKSYIGRSIDIERRWKEHIGTKGSVLLHQDIKNFGIENFTFEILELCHDKEEMILKEEYWIQFYDSFKNGYNQNSGGDNVEQATNITKKNIYQYNLKGEFIKAYDSLSEAERQTGIDNGLISRAAKTNGRTKDFQWRYEFQDKIAPYKRHMGKALEKNRGACKKVRQYSKDLRFIKEFPSIGEASRETGINRSSIGEVCAQKRKTAGGYIWKLAEEGDNYS